VDENRVTHEIVKLETKRWEAVGNLKLAMGLGLLDLDIQAVSVLRVASSIGRQRHTIGTIAFSYGSYEGSLDIW
jgi:hypothetical protein